MPASCLLVGISNQLHVRRTGRASVEDAFYDLIFIVGPLLDQDGVDNENEDGNDAAHSH